MRTPEEMRAALVALQPAGDYYARWMAPAPWAITLRGREWLAATDGHVMVAVAAETADAPRLPADREGRVAKWFTADDGGEPIDLATLAAFVNAGAGIRHCDACNDTREIECDECGGGGEVTCECSHCDNEHEADCEACGGSGSVACRVCADITGNRPAWLRGRVVNRQLIRAILDTIDVRSGAARLSCSAGEMYRLVPDEPEPSWMAVFMAMRDIDPKGVDFDKPETWHEKAA